MSVSDSSSASKLSAISTVPVVYTQLGGGQSTAGWRYEICPDGVRPIYDLLRGRDVRVDCRMNLPRLPQFDIESGDPVGPRRPVVVFLCTDHAISGAQHVRLYEGQSGLFVCKPHLVDVYADDPNILWVTNSKHIKQIQKSDNAILETAKIVAGSLVGPSKLARTLSRVIHWARVLLGFIL